MMRMLARAAYHGALKVLPRDLSRLIAQELAIRRLRETLPFWERREQAGAIRPRVRIGFVGAGKYARHHLRVLSTLSGVELRAICTRGGPRVQEVARDFGIPTVLKDLGELVVRDDVDAFVVVVPILEMKAAVLRCLEAGKPVLLEKPAGLSAADTRELAHAANKRGTFGMVAMNRRFYSVLEHGLAALAGCGPLRGAILQVPEPISERRRSGALPPEIYDRWMFANSIHGIDLIRYVLGDVVSMRTVARPRAELGNAAASFAALLDCEGGAIGTIIALWDTPGTWHLKVIAERGALELSPLEEGWFINGQGLRIPLKVDPIDREFRMGVYAQDLHFVEAVRSGKKPGLPACLLPAAVRTHELIEKMLVGASEDCFV